MALKKLPDEISIIMDDENKGVSIKFVGSEKNILILWLMLSAQVSKNVHMPLSVMSAMMMAHAPNIDKHMFSDSNLRIDMKIPDI